MSYTDEEIRNAFKVFETSRKMLTKRGYIVPDTALTYEKLKANMEGGMKKSQLSYVAEKPTESAAEGSETVAEPEKIFVYFSDDKAIGVPGFKKIQERLETAKANRCIVVLDSTPHAHVRNAMEAVAPKYRYELFKTSQLLIDITEHELVPEHVVLTDDEKKQILRRYNLKESQLPRMMLDDPISKYFGLSRGQVVKITRASETAGRYVTYRIVV